MPLLVQSGSDNRTTGTTLQPNFLSGTTATNCVIAYIGAAQATTNPVVSGITLGGAAGNWAAAKAENTNNGSSDCEIWVDWNCAGGSTSIVVTFTAGTGGFQGNCAVSEEWSGIQSSSNPVDVTNGQTTTTFGTAWSSLASGTLGQASELVVGAVSDLDGSAATITGPSAPWTNTAQVNASTNCGLLAGHQVVSSTASQTYNGTFSTSVSFSAVIVTLKAAPTAGGGGQAPLTPPGRVAPTTVGLRLTAPSPAPQSPPTGQATPTPLVPPGRQSPTAIGLPLTAPSPAPQAPPSGQATGYPLTPPGRQSPVSPGLSLTAPSPAPQTPPVGQATPVEALIPPGRTSPMALSSYLTPGSPQPPPAPVIPPQPARPSLTPPGRLSPMSLGLGLYAPSPAPQTPPVVPPPVVVLAAPGQGRDDKPHLKKLLLLLE